MGSRDKKKSKKSDLLKMSKQERIQLIREVREKLRQKIIEAKLWQSLLDTENLTINGNIVCKSDEPLNGLTLYRAIR